MTITLPPRPEADLAIRIVRTLRAAGHTALFAGGCVRDSLLGREPKDFDVATSARPDQVEALFPKTLAVGKSFGVIVVVGKESSVEVATFRSEGGYADGRHPDRIRFSTPEEDASRRDFTVNGLFASLREDGREADILDYVGGLEDLAARRIRAIGVPSERFALRFTGAETPEQAARELYEKYRPELLAVTQGDRGGILMDEQGMRRYACYPVEVVDSNGCGDTFHGALIAGKIWGLNNDAACRYASAAAAIKCMRLGARYAMADDVECREFLRQRGEPLE